MGSIQAENISFFARAEPIPFDAIFQVAGRCAADTFPGKVNLGTGTYKDDDGNPWILPAVRMAKERIKGYDHEYLPIAGYKAFREAAVRLVFEKTRAYKEGRLAYVQSLSGTGALLIAGLALKKANAGIKKVYLTTPTWPNHELLFGSQGYELGYLPYYKDRAFDFEGYMGALRQAEPGSAVVLHTCAHNPTGCDPSHEQWKEIAAVVLQRRLFPIFDSAYLGFNSGNVDEDAWALRYFVEDCGMEAAICLSFAKNMGLYGERVGCVAFVTSSPEVQKVVYTLLENAQRSTVSMPPKYGAIIAATVLSTPEIREQWAKDLITMSSRIRGMRKQLYDTLLRLKTPGDWSHIVKQTGMFGYTGITEKQVEYLEAKYHVYMSETSRISVAGLNPSNVEYFAKALDDAVRSVQE